MEFVVQFSENKECSLNRKRKVSVINAEGPPVPIPNTEVKLCSGENTLRATVREDSSMLTPRKAKPSSENSYIEWRITRNPKPKRTGRFGRESVISWASAYLVRQSTKSTIEKIHKKEKFDRISTLIPFEVDESRKERWEKTDFFDLGKYDVRFMGV